MKKKYVCIDIETGEIFHCFPHELTQELKDIIKSDREANREVIFSQNEKIRLLEARIMTLQETLNKATIMLYKATNS